MKMRCPFCTDKRDLEFDSLVEHLIVLETLEGHKHIHGPIKNKNKIIEYVHVILKEAGIKKFRYEVEK